MDNILFRILGIILILSGISIWMRPIIYSRRHMMIYDFTGINHIVCLFLVVLGFAFIWTTRKKTVKRNKDDTYER
jgi:uncharacterized membrane protein